MQAAPTLALPAGAGPGGDKLLGHHAAGEGALLGAALLAVLRRLHMPFAAPFALHALSTPIQSLRWPPVSLLFTARGCSGLTQDPPPHLPASCFPSARPLQDVSGGNLLVHGDGTLKFADFGYAWGAEEADRK